MVVCAAFLVGLAAGWEMHERHFLSSRYTYEDVLIQQRVDARNFYVRPARMQTFHFHSCTDLDWQQWEKIRKVTFQRQTDCLDAAAKGSYEFYTEHGKRMIFKEEEADVRY